MSGDRIIGFIIVTVGSIVAALLAILILSHLIASPVALEPGDALYPQQQNIVGTFATVLPWLVVGGGGAALVIIASMRDSF